MEELEIISKKDRKHYIWVEKYRPKCLNDYLGNETVKETFSRYIKQQDISHILLVGGPGQGKSSLAKILMRDIKCDSLYINASDERGIDTIRDKVKSFASTSGFNPLKIMVLDECVEEDTLVSVLRGKKTFQLEIKSLNDKTDLVKSYNIKKRRIEWKPCLLLDKGMLEGWDLEFESGEIIRCTDSHKWYVQDSNKIIKLKLEDIIKRNIKSIYSYGELLKIRKISKLLNLQHMYDLHVNTNHNFFVGKTEILTSNCDGITIDGQRSLRSIMEQYALHTRFILSANYRERIIEPIQSRCQVFEIEPPNKKEVAINLVNILKQENVKYTMEDIGIIINTYYPDIRKTIQFAQQSVIDGSIKITQSQLVQSDIKTKLVDFLKNKSPFLEIRKYINDQNINRFEEIYQYLYENLDNFAQGKEATVILKIADGIKNDTMVVNKQIVFLACIIEILKVLKG